MGKHPLDFPMGFFLENNIYSDKQQPLHKNFILLVEQILNSSDATPSREASNVNN
jgi:hypothetical protein